jgi:hypothetical protein
MTKCPYGISDNVTAGTELVKLNSVIRISFNRDLNDKVGIGYDISIKCLA